MKLTKLNVVLLFSVSVMIVAPVRGVFAATININAEPITSTFTKSGLNGFFYSVEVDGQDKTADQITSITTANSWIAAHSAATGTFTSTQNTLDTGGGYGTTAGSNDKATEEAFLGTDSSLFVGTDDIQGTNILNIVGYIDVTGDAGTQYTITEISNDGSFLTIGGTQVISVGNSTTTGATTTTQQIKFVNGPGIYAIDLTYWNQAYGDNTGTGNELGLNIVGAGGAVVTFGSAFPSGVPEPSTWVALMVGGLMMGALVMRRKKIGGCEVGMAA